MALWVPDNPYIFVIYLDWEEVEMEEIYVGCLSSGTGLGKYTSSSAQGGGGSFKNRKPIGEVGCCASRVAERSHWWTERWLRSPLFLSLSFSDYLPTYLPIYLSICLSVYLSIYLSIYRSIYLSVYLSIYLSTYPSLYPSILSIYLSIYLSTYPSLYPSILSIYLSTYLAIYLSHLSI